MMKSSAAVFEPGRRNAGAPCPLKWEHPTCTVGGNGRNPAVSTDFRGMCASVDLGLQGAAVHLKNVSNMFFNVLPKTCVKI